MMKTLYITDLDGTLLTSVPDISRYTADTINRLVKNGVLFSYATARSNHTAGPLTRAIHGNIPVIIYNGAFILDHATGQILSATYFERAECDEVFAALGKIHPIVYAFTDGVERFSYADPLINAETRDFVNSRIGDPRRTPVKDPTALRAGHIFYFTCIGDERTLFPAYEVLRDKYTCVYQRDIYSGCQWLEIMPAGVSKASAILKLKALLNCERVVSFGDGKNDIPMFEISDACYAVANAAEELKAIATGIIGSNNEDGVAKWLERNATV